MIDFFKVKPTVEEDLARIAEIVKGAENRILFLVDDGEYCIVDQLGRDVDTISLHAELTEYFPEEDVVNAAFELNCPFVIFEGSYHSSFDYYGDFDAQFNGDYRAPTDKEMEAIDRCYENYEHPRLWPSANLLADLRLLHWHYEQRMEHYAKPSTTDWAFCPRCGGSLDTGWECVKCGADWRWVK